MVFTLGLMAASSAVIAQSRIMGGVSFAALVMVTWRLWLPVVFEFRSRGVAYGVLGRSRQIPWSQVARFEPKRHGLLLFAEDDRSPLAPLRSIHIHWNGQRAAILEVVKYYTSARVSVASTRTYLDETIEHPDES